MTALLVMPDGAGCWVLEPPEGDRPRRVYTSASEAEAAARVRARIEGRDSFLVIDRYNRLRATPVGTPSRVG
jgi:hypothetical protein